MKTPERRQWRRSGVLIVVNFETYFTSSSMVFSLLTLNVIHTFFYGVFIINFEHISHLFLVFLLLFNK